MFVMIGVGALSCLTTSILPLRKIVPHYGILVRNGDGGYSLSDHFYSAPSRKYAPLWYICHDGGGALSYLTTSILPLRKIMPHYGIFVMIWGGAISYLTTSILPLREIVPHCVIFVMIGVRAINYLTTSILPLREIKPHYGIFVTIGGGGYKLSDHFYSVPCKFMHQYGIFVKNGDGVLVILPILFCSFACLFPKMVYLSRMGMGV